MHHVNAPRFICPTSAAKFSAREAKTECMSASSSAARPVGGIQQVSSQTQKSQGKSEIDGRPPTSRAEDREASKLCRTTHLDDAITFCGAGFLYAPNIARWKVGA